MFAEHTGTRRSEINGADSFLWSPAGHSISIHLACRVIESINRLIAEASGEIGGLLLGRAEGHEVWIEDLETVSCTAENAPWRLSIPEQVALKKKIARHNMQDGDRHVVGFYRARTQQGLKLTDDDCALCAGCFSDPRNVFLLIQSKTPDSNRGAFFFWEGNAITRDASYLEFPFKPERAEAATKPFALPPFSSIPDPPRRRLLVPGLVMAAVGIAAIGVASHFSAAAVPPPPRPLSPALGLSASEKSDLVSVRWDRNSRIVAEARHGKLSIRNGTFEKSIDVDAQELRNGSVVYARLPAEGEIRLEIFNGKTSVSEVLHLAGKSEPVATATPVRHHRSRRSRHRRRS